MIWRFSCHSIVWHIVSSCESAVFPVPLISLFLPCIFPHFIYCIFPLLTQHTNACSCTHMHIMARLFALLLLVHCLVNDRWLLQWKSQACQWSILFSFQMLLFLFLNVHRKLSLHPYYIRCRYHWVAQPTVQLQNSQVSSWVGPVHCSVLQNFVLDLY